MNTHPHSPQIPLAPARRTITLTAVVTAAAMALGACAAFGPSTPEQAVQARAKARYAALVSRDLQTLYQIVAPSQRQVLSYERWSQRYSSRGMWSEATVRQVRCQEKRCAVTMSLRVERPGGLLRDLPYIETDLVETWVLEEGQWWFFQPL